MEFKKFNFPEGNFKPEAGKLLIAQPLLYDPNFTRSVILLCEHGENGSLGFVINHANTYTLEELVPQIFPIPIKVFKGGPVEENTLHLIHRIPEILGGKEIAKNIYWGGSFEILKSELIDKQQDLKDIRLFFGYSGWDTGQLEQEMESKTWLVAPIEENIVFEEDTSQIWKKSIALLGKEFSYLNNIPINPQFN